MNNLSKIQKIANRLIQLVIFVITYLFIYNQVFHRTDLPGLLSGIKDDLLKPVFQIRLTIIILLMTVNWCIETIKWRFLIAKVEQIGFFKALQAVLAGVSISSFTPNRIGEYFGRAFVLKKSRIEGILITLVGSMSQLLVTVIAGTISMLIFIPGWLVGTPFRHGFLYTGTIIFVLTLDIVLLALFFNLSFLGRFKKQIIRKRFKRIRKFFRIFAFYHNRELATVLILSLARYFVFSTQFFLLFRLFDVEISYGNALVLISLIYLVMAVIPTIALTELGIRGSVALYFFGLYFGHPYTGDDAYKAGVFAASTLLWMINLGIPALIGTIFLFRLQFFRKNDEGN